jgi:hypothetical protein
MIGLLYFFKLNRLLLLIYLLNEWAALQKQMAGLLIRSG